jgi:dolichol kinase
MDKVFPLCTVGHVCRSAYDVTSHMTSFINNDKNEQPRESLHMILLIIFFIPTQFRPSTCLRKYHAMPNSQGQIPLRWGKN